MHKRRGLFFQSLFITLILVLPMMAAVAYLAGLRGEQQTARVSAEKTALAEPAGAHSTHRLLLAVQGETPAFLLLRLDGPAQQIRFCALPGQMQIRAPAGFTTLADCYLSAGPARAADLLTDTVGLAPDAYLAATADGFASIWGEEPAVRLDLAAMLTEAARAALPYETDGTILELTAEETPAFLGAVAALPGVKPPDLARVRAAVWAALFRQGRDRLADLTEGVRAASSRTLTDLRAQDLALIEETLQWLAEAGGLTVDYETAALSPAAGSWQLTQEGLATVREILAGGAPATPESAAL